MFAGMVDEPAPGSLSTRSVSPLELCRQGAGCLEGCIHEDGSRSHAHPLIVPAEHAVGPVVELAGVEAPGERPTAVVGDGGSHLVIGKVLPQSQEVLPSNIHRPAPTRL